jgi:GNAT superfamily N-acetyltransferase
VAGRLLVTIREARLGDLPRLVEIEDAAETIFPALSVDFDPLPGGTCVEELVPYAESGRAFVAADEADTAVAYVLVDVLDGAAHIEQVSVHPDHARQGIGRRLIERTAEWARAHGYRSLILTTYVDVPWNAPYYERLGFRPLAAAEETAGLRAIRARERAIGLDVWPRISMARRLD